MENRCLICLENKLKEVLFIEKFPLYFGAIPKNEVESIKSLPLEISYCLNCKLLQQTHLPDQRLLDDIYQKEYYSCPSPVTTNFKSSKKFIKFFRTFKVSGNLLEIACFDGYFLNEVKSKKLTVYGCDPSPMISKAENLIGTDKIKKRFFNSSLYPKEYFDVVVFRNLLEHLTDINQFMVDVKHVLKPNGYIFIDVPNLDVLDNLGGFGTFFHQHISYFSKNTLSYYCKNHNLEIIGIHEGNPNLFMCLKKNKSTNSYEIKKPNYVEKELFKNTDKFKENLKSLFYKHNDIIFFGASALATTIIKFLNKGDLQKVKKIYDNDLLKHGKYIYGHTQSIEHPKKLMTEKFDIIIITTFFFYEEIYEQLINLNINKNKIKILNGL